MVFVDWDEKVEALAPDGSDQPFTIRIRFGCPDGRFQDPDAETLQLGIAGRENRIAVVDGESVRMIKRHELAELLNRPLGSRMVGHVGVENAPRTDLHRDKDVQNAEGGGHGNEKVTGDDRPRDDTLNFCVPQDPGKLNSSDYFGSVVPRCIRSLLFSMQTYSIKSQPGRN